ncbi:uncharacterized protein LOC116288358 [Actinia tenebrosa]|uniref:Uncharacterized protein LOC116288358 n=1 Tax=Actinia tenebrosa TaxID=6105 RepID=A0A6P8HEJ0_ACTTE|nr:uncharacterized protein LOC116288358 [Actinia tenebrosa]
MLYMDGADIGLSLFGGAKFQVKDNRPSLFLQKDTKDYSTIPRFNFYTTDLTIGLWVNLKSTDDKMYILNDKGDSGKSARIFLDNGRFRAEMEFLSGGNTFEGNGRLSANEWHHIALTWHRESRLFRLYINGILDNEEQSGKSDPNLKPTTEPYFLIGKRHSSSSHATGWISDWAVLFQTLSKDEISLLKDGKASEGAWIGLSDIQVENQIKWSDRTPLTYQPNNDLSNTDDSADGSAVIRLYELTLLTANVSHSCLPIKMLVNQY